MRLQCSGICRTGDGSELSAHLNYTPVFISVGRTTEGLIKISIYDCSRPYIVLGNQDP